MTKTRLLLAFGRHGTSGKTLGPMLGNTRFFKKAARDFVRGKKDQVAIIHEQGPMLGMESSLQISRLMDVWSALNAYKGFVQMREEAIADIEPKRAHLERVMNRKMREEILGIQKNAAKTRFAEEMHKAMLQIQKEVLGIELTEEMSDHFGMVAFARKRQDQVEILVERQSGEAYYLGVLHGILEKALSLRMMRHQGDWSEKDMEIMIEYLKVSAKLEVHRDRNVISQIEAVADANQGTIFIVPRGYGHRHMAKIVDESRFEVTLKEDDGGSLGFEDDVLSMSYSQELGEEELRKYAALNLDYVVRMELLWSSFMQEVEEILETQKVYEAWEVAEEKIAAALDGISKKAREFALDNEKK